MWLQKDVKSQGLLTAQELTYEVDRSLIWVKTKIKELNIKPEIILKKKFYYNQEVIPKIKKLIK
jgi:hypothetical protein